MSQEITLEARIGSIRARVHRLVTKQPDFEQRVQRLQQRRRPDLEQLERWLLGPRIFDEQRLVALLWMASDPREEIAALLKRYDPEHDAHSTIDLYSMHRLASFHYYRLQAELKRGKDIA